MAAPIAVQGAERALALDHSPQPRQHRHRRFFFHQLRVINLAAGVVQNHDQVVPALARQLLLRNPVIIVHMPFAQPGLLLPESSMPRGLRAHTQDRV